MASNLELVRARGSMRERLIAALDIDSLDQAQELVRLLAGDVACLRSASSCLPMLARKPSG